MAGAPVEPARARDHWNPRQKGNAGRTWEARSVELTRTRVLWY